MHMIYIYYHFPCICHAQYKYKLQFLIFLVAHYGQTFFFWRVCKHQTFTKLMKIKGSSESKVDEKHQQYSDGHNPFLWKKKLLSPRRRRAKTLPINASICTIMIEECPGFCKIQAFFGLASSLACCFGFSGSACLSSSFSPSLKNSMAVRSTTWV